MSVEWSGVKRSGVKRLGVESGVGSGEWGVERDHPEGVLNCSYPI